MTLAARGQSMANRLGQTAAGVTVTYERSGVFSVSLTAEPAEEQVTAATVGTTLKPRREDAERDYLLLAADLLDGNDDAFLPKRGDRVSETLNGATVVFEVVPRDGEPAWRWSDRQRTKVRVHTRRVN